MAGNEAEGVRRESRDGVVFQEVLSLVRDVWVAAGAKMQWTLGPDHLRVHASAVSCISTMRNNTEKGVSG